MPKGIANNKKLSIQSLYNYFYVILTLLWIPLQKTVLHIDGKGRILFFMTIFALITNLKLKSFRRIALSTPASIWLIWCIYVTINAIVKGYSVAELPFSFYIVLKILCPYVIMAVSAYEYTKNNVTFLKALLITFIVYSTIGFFFMDNFYIAEEEGRSADNTLGNLLALNAIFIAFFAGLLMSMKVISKKYFYLFFAYAAAIITLSATRKAFGALFIIYIFIIFSQTKPTFGNILKLLFILLILYIGLDYVINNTYLGERFGNIEESAESFVDTNNPFLKLVGDRAFFYVIGWEVFLNNALSGIGLTNFPTYTRTSLFIHTEYIVQLCECGIIGTCLFAMFYTSILKNIIKKRNSSYLDKTVGIVMIGVIVAILFIGLTAWLYDFAFFFAVIGVVIGYTKTLGTR